MRETERAKLSRKYLEMLDAAADAKAFANDQNLYCFHPRIYVTPDF